MKTPKRLIWQKEDFDLIIKDVRKFVESLVTELYVKQDEKLSKVDRSRMVKNNVEIIEQLYNKASPTFLTDQLWRQLKNTDSWDTTTPALVERSILASKIETSLSSVIEEFNSGNVRCPIIVKCWGKYTVVWGDVHLMVARAGKIPPKIILLLIK